VSVPVSASGRGRAKRRSPGRRGAPPRLALRTRSTSASQAAGSRSPSRRREHSAALSSRARPELHERDHEQHGLQNDRDEEQSEADLIEPKHLAESRNATGSVVPREAPRLSALQAVHSPSPRRRRDRHCQDHSEDSQRHDSADEELVPVRHHPMVSSPGSMGKRRHDTDDTATSCWLCDREHGEICHVHDPAERARRERCENDALLDAAWVLPVRGPAS
jgi:hypothetical protein